MPGERVHLGMMDGSGLDGHTRSRMNSLKVAELDSERIKLNCLLFMAFSVEFSTHYALLYGSRDGTFVTLIALVLSEIFCRTPTVDGIGTAFA